MLRFNQNPNEKQILQAASLARLTWLPIEIQMAIANGIIHLKTVASTTNSDYIRERALLYAFYAEEQLREDFSDDLFITNCADSEYLEFQVIKPARVENSLHGMSLSYYANKIHHRVPDVWRYFRISVKPTQSIEEVLGTIQKSLYGEAKSIEASYAVADGRLFIEFTIMATYEVEKRAYRKQWLQSILLYISRHYGLESNLPMTMPQSAPFFSMPELAAVASESVLERLTRQNDEFASYCSNQQPSHSIFELDLAMEQLIPPKDALACIETIRAIRLEVQGKMD